MPMCWGYSSRCRASQGCALRLCITVIHRLDDDDDKLVLAPEGRAFSNEQILALTEFQERFFQAVVVRGGEG
jgi:hypothetical protein